MDESYPQLPRPGIIPTPPKKGLLTDKNKLLVIILAACGGFLVLLVLVTLIWPHGHKKAIVQTAKPAPTGQYYYLDSYAIDPTTPNGSMYTIGFINPYNNKIQKTPIKLDAGMHPTGTIPLQFSADGRVYLSASSDQPDGNLAPTPKTFQLSAGRLPSGTEKVLLTDSRRADYRDWLLTADGKEVVYIDTIVGTDKTVTSQTLYSINVASGKSTKIGDVTRPIDRDNSRLFEVVKDKTVSFYTSQDDGIYQTTYDRAKQTVTQNKVVIKAYDWGFMGMPSPDGSKMLYFSGTAGVGNFTVYLFDLKKGGVTPLLETPAKYGGYNNGYWSPDSKLAILTSALKDINGAHYKNQLLTVDTTIKATKTELLGETISPGADNSKSAYNATSWSPDGRYITFLQNNQLHFYDLHQHTVLAKTTIGHDMDLTYSTIGGWITP